MKHLARRLWGAVVCLALGLALTACGEGAAPSADASDISGSDSVAAAFSSAAESGGSSSGTEPSAGTTSEITVPPEGGGETNTGNGQKAEMPELPLDPENGEAAGAEPLDGSGDWKPSAGENYVFGTPLTASEPAEDAHFDGAAFLGDSRTEGLQLFGGLKRGDYLWLRGAVTYIADDAQYAMFGTEDQKMTMLQALEQKLYDSVYIMVGINELGNTPKRFESALGKFLDSVVAAQPEAVVYLQTIPPVNDAALRAGGQPEYINNAGIDVFNEIIVRAAAEKKVVLLDTAEVYRGEDGQLPAEMTSDGCHFYYKYYRLWVDYLRSHVMDADTYHALRAQAGAAVGVTGQQEATR